MNGVGRGWFDVVGDEPSPSADMGGVSPGPVPLLRGVSQVQSGADVGRGEPNPSATVQMWAEAGWGILAKEAHGGECAAA